MRRMSMVVPLVLATAVAIVSVAGDVGAGGCPPRVHPDPAPNEQCGRDHYESAAAARRCAYEDAVARLTPQERKQCEIEARVNHAEHAAAAASADAAAARAAAEASARAAADASARGTAPLRVGY